MAPIFTIGHSTRPIDEFVTLLRKSDVGCAVDIRAIPASRTNPQYNGAPLAHALRAVGIDYRHMPALGGRRGRRRDVDPDTNAFWSNASFHNYADYALSDEFRGALQSLRDVAHAKRSAIMCSEAVWWRCHRRIVTDYLIAGGETVFHIVSRDRVEPARMTEHAVRRLDGTLVYPPSSVGSPTRS